MAPGIAANLFCPPALSWQAAGRWSRALCSAWGRLLRELRCGELSKVAEGTLIPEHRAAESAPAEQSRAWFCTGPSESAAHPACESCAVRAVFQLQVLCFVWFSSHCFLIPLHGGARRGTALLSLRTATGSFAQCTGVQSNKTHQPVCSGSCLQVVMSLSHRGLLAGAAPALTCDPRIPAHSLPGEASCDQTQHLHKNGQCFILLFFVENSAGATELHCKEELSLALSLTALSLLAGITPSFFL